MSQQEKDQVCCPEFNPGLWDDKIHEWQDKKFIKDSVFTIFYMPVNFGKVMHRMDKKVKAAGADMPGYLCLSDHTSKWNMDVYLEVDKEIPEADNVSLSGKYYSKVYEGPYKDTAKWTENFKETIRQKGMDIKKWFMWYTTCPKCAKKYGKNYVAIVSEVEE